ncbi:MAG: 4-hydroxybenzoate octaprenyltransferase [Uliginosibacterium sp.]|jgi:4-hydroxybenzoate polyprenyltransferase|nr:4-hydroxybenzoate octaprenyltransferase [Uliginosibacterium sp.]MBK9616855.1 4-hydroxybenzoate octaprenyltransferase [Uliginosibacterium sp.]
MRLMQKLDAYEKLMRLDKPIGTLLLLWPTLWGLWLAGEGKPDLMTVWIFALGTLLMRSAGCVINDWADRRFDGEVARTRERPLVTGRVSPREALFLAAGLALVAFLLVLRLPKLVWWLSVPALLLAASYPFTKRFFAVPQAYLGFAFGFGIPMAFAALQGNVPVLAWILLLANVFWAIAYDTEYAMVDREDDLRIGIKTSAITFGRFDVWAVMVCYLFFLLTMVGAGWLAARGGFYYLGLAGGLGLAVYHGYLIRGRDRDRCFAAFRHNSWIGAVVFLGIVLDFAVQSFSG